MIDVFLAWWVRQMLDLLPARLRGAGGGTTDALIVDASPAPPLREVALLLRRRGQESTRGRFALDPAGLRALRDAAGGLRRLPVVLRVASGVLLERRITLPLAAERGLGQMLRYEMDRLTPFAADEVYFAWEVTAREPAQRRLALRLLLMPRAGVQHLLDALAAAGLPVRRLEEGARGIALGAPEAARQRRLLAVGAAACAALGIAVVAVPFVQQATAARLVARHIAALRPGVEEAQALRRRLAGRSQGSDVLAEERARVGDALLVLATLTDLLPDDTFITELRLQSAKLHIDGESASAAKLILALAASRLIGNPTFAAPVTRLPDRAADLFSIRAEIVPRDAP